MSSQWLAAIAATGLLGTTLGLPPVPLADEAWASLIEGVHRERLSGFLLAAIDNEPSMVTESQREAATELHLESMVTVVLLERSMLMAVEVLESAGVQPRVLKGSAVAHLDYAEAAMRPFIDVDLLIRPEQFDAAVTALVAAGYARNYPEPRPSFDRRFSKGVSFRGPDNCELDLHRTFVMGPYGLTLDLDQLWETSEDFTVAGRTLSALGSEARLLHACYHASLGDARPRLVPRRDIAEMVLFGRPDLDRLHGLARDSRAESVLAEAVRSAWKTLAIADTVALSAWAADYRTPPRDRRDIDVYLGPNNNYAAKSLAALRVLPNWRDRAAFLTALTLPQTSYLGERHDGLGSRLRHGVSDVLRGRAR
jgi:Uncharacterised nucleotidyltransferase